MQYGYPEYTVQWTPQILATCREAAQRLLEDVGLLVKHGGFVNAIRGREGVTVRGDRVCLSRRVYDEHLEAYLARNRESLIGPSDDAEPAWSISCDGFSIAVIDIDTDEVRPATCNDLRELIRLANSLGVPGSYPCCPQDLPPLMRALATFRICWEESDAIRPFDYLDPRQTPFLYDMHQVMGEPFVININVPRCMTLCEQDIDTFMRYYPLWREDHSRVGWYSICDYPLVGIIRPITATGSVAAYLAQSFGTHMLFQLFDPEIQMAPRLLAGMPVDLQSMNFAWGSPRMHLYQFLNETVLPVLCGLSPEEYRASSAFMCSGSCAVDARAGMEKMATALTAAMQGARSFGGAGNLAVDDLFSGVQLVLDVEIFEYIKELVGAFDPHPCLMGTDGLYEMIREVAETGLEFYAHPETAAAVRKLLPVSKRRPHEKLRAWMIHERNIKDRIRDECHERIRKQSAFALEESKAQALRSIYDAAERALVG